MLACSAPTSPASSVRYQVCAARWPDTSSTDESAGRMGQGGNRVSSFVQYIHGQALALDTGARAGLIRRRLVRKSVQAIHSFDRDPDVEYVIGGRALALPFSHELPAIWIRYPDYSFNLARIAAACESKYPDASMIDVGANVGDSAAIVRTQSQLPILCVEGDAQYLRLLEVNARHLDHVEIAPYYVGPESGQVSMRVVSERGTAHLERVAEGTHSITMRTLQEIVADSSPFSGARLLKIDTDGYEVKIIRGSADFLESARPCLFFEYDPRFFALQGDDGLTLFPFLAQLGYLDVMVWDNIGMFLLSTGTSDLQLLTQLNDYYARRPTAYMDIACFHSDDHDLFEEVLARETEHLRAMLLPSGSGS